MLFNNLVHGRDMNMYNYAQLAWSVSLNSVFYQSPHVCAQLVWTMLLIVMFLIEL